VRQLTYIKPGHVEWHDVPRPKLAADTDALVRPLAVARCDLDLYIVTGTGTGTRTWPGPFALGHEAVGVVAEAGDAAGVRPGDVVVVPFQLSCGRCANCRRGLTGTCTSYPPRAAYGLKPSSGTEFGGALSELIRVPFADHMLVKVPKGLDPTAIASMTDNFPDGWRAVAPELKAQPGARVLVVGGRWQATGLYAAGLAVSLGAGDVLYLDDDADRRAAAKKMGARAEPLALGEREPEAKFEITVDASADPDALRFAAASTAPNGTLSIVAMYFAAGVAFPLEKIYANIINVRTGRIHARSLFPEVLAHCADGHFHPEAVTSRHAPFSQAAEAYFDPGPKLVLYNDWPSMMPKSGYHHALRIGNQDLAPAACPMRVPGGADVAQRPRFDVEDDLARHGEPA
jgi:threonine dehydrogenase-like Zn-dependent dehydrogenase